MVDDVSGEDSVWASVGVVVDLRGTPANSTPSKSIRPPGSNGPRADRGNDLLSGSTAVNLLVGTGGTTTSSRTSAPTSSSVATGRRLDYDYFPGTASIDGTGITDRIGGVASGISDNDFQFGAEVLRLRRNVGTSANHCLSGATATMSTLRVDCRAGSCVARQDLVDDSRDLPLLLAAQSVTPNPKHPPYPLRGSRGPRALDAQP